MGSGGVDFFAILGVVSNSKTLGFGLLCPIPKALNIDLVHFVGFRGFHDDRGGFKAGVVDEASEGGFADFAFAEVIVAVDAGAEGFFAVVAVDDFDFVAPNEAVKFGKGGFVGFWGADVVSGGEDVAGIEADGEVFGVSGEFEDFGEVLKFVVEG